MYKIIKRNGSVVDFNIDKIIVAITKAFESQHKQYTPGIIDFLALKVTADFESKIKNDKVSVEDIQDSVENVLVQAGYSDVAKAYILYRKQHEKIRDMKATFLDYEKLVNGYLNVSDWRVKENSTVTYSVGGLILNNSGAITANYWLSEVYDEEIADAHRNADIHIHDLSMLTGYCFTGDTRIKTLDGKNPTFKELVDAGTQDIWLYAYDTKKKCIVPAKGVFPRVTRTTSDLIRITLTDKSEILCTPDHPFLLRNGVYVEAKKLRANDSLMPLYIGEKGKYTSINKAWNSTSKKQYVHRWICEHMLGKPLRESQVIHHIDGNKHNNVPENLQIMNDRDHRAISIKKTMESNVWKISNKNRLVEYNKSTGKRQSISEQAKQRKRSDNGQFLSFKYNPSADVEQACYNHCVRKVETIHMATPIDVYDITVPDYSNFALDAGVFVHNCAGWSLRKLIKEGLGGVPGKITSAPASHLSTLCNQMVNFLGILQNEWAGAQAFSSFDTYLASFVKADNLSYKEVKQALQSFIFGVNTPSRWGTQAPFSNVTLDWVCPPDLAEFPAIIGGKEQDFTYGDCQKEMDMVNKAFIEIMLQGDANGRGFQYPIPTYSITSNFDWSDTENNRLLFEMTAKYGTPYFSNYVNSDMEPSDVRSMCCRLRLDLRELRKKSGGFFGSGEETGSVGVVTINMPRIAYLAENEEDFFRRLNKLMDISARSIHIKRGMITTLLERGLYPYTKRYLGSYNNHFSTIGLIGMNEVGLNAKWLGKDMTHVETQKFTKKVLNHMRERLMDYQEMYEGELFNLEATPAESTTYRFAKHDKERYPDIISASPKGETPYYTNSSHLPVDFTSDIFEALDVQDNLQTLYTSGTVFHAFLGEKLPDWKAAASLVRKIAENYKLPYYTLSPTYSICKEHGYINGEVYKCPICGNDTEVYSRITGYYRPVQNWNDGKAEEFKQRVVYSDKRENAEYANILFASKTCPKCKIATQMLDKAGVDYKLVYVDEGNEEYARSFDIKQAPTLVYCRPEGTEKYSGLPAIKESLK